MYTCFLYHETKHVQTYITIQIKNDVDVDDGHIVQVKTNKN